MKIDPALVAVIADNVRALAKFIWEAFTKDHPRPDKEVAIKQIQRRALEALVGAAGSEALTLAVAAKLNLKLVDLEEGASSVLDAFRVAIDSDFPKLPLLGEVEIVPPDKSIDDDITPLFKPTSTVVKIACIDGVDCNLELVQEIGESAEAFMMRVNKALVLKEKI